MKIRVACREENREKVAKAVELGEMVLAEDAEFIIVEAARMPSMFLTVKERGEYIRIPIKDIVYLESMGNEVMIHTADTLGTSTETLYHLQLILAEKGFLRIHKSYIVQIDKIKRIRTSFNTKFILEMITGDQIEVSRTYYYQFKEILGL